MGILGLMLKAPRLMLASSSKSTRPFGEPRARIRKSAKKLTPPPGRGLARRSGPCRGGVGGGGLDYFGNEGEKKPTP